MTGIRAATTSRWVWVKYDHFDFRPGMWQEGLSGKGEGKGCAWKKSLAVLWEVAPCA